MGTNSEAEINEELFRPPIRTLINYYDHLLAGDTSAIVELFAVKPRINTPLDGELQGRRAVAQYVSEQEAWLKKRKARSELINLIVGKERVVVELVLFLSVEGQQIDLPVAIVADREGEAMSAVRIYHSTWPLTGQHRVRAPIVDKPVNKLEEPAVIEAYMKGLGTPDKALLLSLFTDDGYAREPSGARYKHAGPEGLRQFYNPALDSGGIILHHCTATFDGRNFAVEYICDEWANVQLPPQAGIAVYELAGQDKLKAARIYDDVMPPFE